MSNRTLRRLAPFVVLTVVFAGLLYRAEHKAETGISHVDQHVTEITSPCLRYGAKSQQCRRSFEAAVATIDHPEACAVERKAGTLKALRELAHSLDVDFKEPCKGARLAQERRRGNERRHTEEGAATLPRSGGDASIAPTGHSLPAPHGSGGASVPAGDGGHGAPAPGKSGSHAPPAPGEGGGGAPSPGTPAAPAPTAPSAPGASSPPATEPPTETPVVEGTPAPEAPVRQGAGALLESVGGVVEETGGAVNETLHGLGCTVGGLTGAPCE